MSEDRRLPAVMIAIAAFRSPDVDRRDPEFVAEVERAAKEFLAMLDASVVFGVFDQARH